MADSIELRASVTSIKRVDPYVKDIIATATQVALYKFNISTNEWEKTDKEGALFIYSRNGEPYHSIMVVNRLNTDNFIEPIVRDFDCQMQVPFLLYRNCKSKIFGIWFFNREECLRIAFIIESLMEGLKGKYEDRSEKKGNGVDIFSMLSKAQEDFNKTPTKQDSLPPTFSSTPRIPDVPSQSVMDFFAKASSKSSQKPVVSSENVLQRLMSNPAHSVEHIEKQQRSITPQELVNIRPKVLNADRRSAPINFPSSASDMLPEKSLQHENGLLPSPQSNPMSSASPLAFLIQSQNREQPPQVVADEGADSLGTSPFAQFLENAQKPTLMTPMMFTASSSSSKQGKIKDESVLSSCEGVEILTEKQLAQAFMYLLKNDPSFIKQIHEAYVNSIMEKFNNASGSGKLL